MNAPSNETKIAATERPPSAAGKPLPVDIEAGKLRAGLRPTAPVNAKRMDHVNLSVRERLAQHRANAACASCHNLMDPPGFALENYDAVGRWRILEEGKPVDASGGLPDGSKFDGVGGLERALLQRPELFVGTLTEKLLTFALGRGVEPFDGPAVRQIVRDAQADNYRLSSIIVGITESTPFTMRKTP